MSPRRQPLQHLADRLEALVVGVGRIGAWLTFAMVCLTVVVVVLRYFFDAGWIWMQELVTWAHAAVFLLGAAYTLARDEHVRVDVLYRGAAPRNKAWVNVLGTLLLLFPVCGFLAWVTGRYALTSWRLAERSAEAGGLPYPLIPVGKSLLFAMSVLLLLEGIVILLRNGRALRSGTFTSVAQPQHEDVL